MKLAVRIAARIAAIALCLFLALCAYLAANTHEQDQYNNQYAPNIMYRIRMPCPPPCDEQTLDAALKQVPPEGNLVTVKKEVGPGVLRRMYHAYNGIN